MEPLAGSEAREFFDIAAFIESVRPAWMNQSACRNHPEVNFFPTPGESLRPAKAVCKECPVQAECLDHAIQAKTLRGVWGGLGERQRQRLYQRRFQ